MKSYISTALKILVAVGILAWLISRGFFDLNSLIKIATPVNIFLFSILVFFNTWGMSERTRTLLSVHIAKYSFFQVFKLTIMGFIFNFIMPGGVGGDVVKGIYLVKNNPQHRAKAVLALLVDRAVGLYCMNVLAVVVMLIDLSHVEHSPQLKAIFFSMLAAAISLTIGSALCLNKHSNKILHKIFSRFPKVLATKLTQVAEGLYEYGQTPSALVKAVLLSLVSQSLAICIFYLVASTLGFSELSFSVCFIAVPIGFIVTALPITPGGVGLGQAVFYYIFELYDKGSGSVGTTAVTIMQLGQLLLGLWGAYYFIRSEKHLSWSATDLKEI